ncbi:MAG: restriction endonuclease subunit R [Cyclobacteriaceae bacterium]|nr:MAG: restriction endonuclease subunit R [Cyclobacteriaceae bacterium]
MIKLNLPDYPLKTRCQGNQDFIFDQFRKKYVLLTPEEWVRQHFLNYLVNDLGYPKSLVKVESGLSVNRMGKRTDILVYSQQIKPFLLIECKAANVPLSDKTFDQLSLYNQAIRAEYLVITNGIKHYCCFMDYETNSYQFQSQLPAYNLQS